MLENQEQKYHNCDQCQVKDYINCTKAKYAFQKNFHLLHWYVILQF